LAANPDISGILHFTDAGVASWYDVANVVLETLRRHGRLPTGVVVTPVGTDAFPRPAARPACAVLDKRESWKLLGSSPVDWRQGIITSTLEILHA
jgi:dTDP-4-dehydrorhamnose reductase